MDDNRYTFYIEKPEELPAETAQAPRKKRNRIAIMALVLAGALFFSAIGGISGVYLVNYIQPPEQYSQPLATSQDNPAPDANSAPSNPVTSQEPAQNSNSADMLAVITSPAGGQMTIPQVFEKCDPAVVAISTETTTNIFGQNVSQASAGSGFIISADGFVVTNNHVISGAVNITVMLHDGREYKATVVGSDKMTDLAVLKIDGNGFAYLDLGDSSKLVVGEQVVAIGNPLGELANSLSVGYISSLARTINIDGDPMVMLQTDASVSPGNSGGPLINLYGQVVGIVSAKSTGSGVEGLGFAIPMNSALDVINSLIDKGYVTGRPYFGISVQLFTGNNASYYNITPGLYIMSVDSGSCADKAGLKVGDRIISLGGAAIGSVSDLQAQKLTFKAGDTTVIVIDRSGQELSLSITFDEDKTTPVPSQAPGNSGGSPQLPWGNGQQNPWGGQQSPWGVLPWDTGNDT